MNVVSKAEEGAREWVPVSDTVRIPISVQTTLSQWSLRPVSSGGGRRAQLSNSHGPTARSERAKLSVNRENILEATHFLI